MGYKLCIAEKPSVGRDIARVVGADRPMGGYFEGNGYLVTWAIGHLVGLAEPAEYGYVPQGEIYTDGKTKAMDELPLIPDNFKLVVLRPTAKQFNIVRDLLRRGDVDEVIDCGDMGAEGHILQWFIREKAGCGKKVLRFCATSMTDEAIRAAMGNLRPIGQFENMIRGEYCKKKADWILGMSMSRAVSLRYSAGVNVGRVQSPTLYFVAQRYLDVEGFVAMDYYTMVAHLQEGFDLHWSKDTDGLLPDGCKDGENRDMVVVRDALDNAAVSIRSHGTGRVLSIEKKKMSSNRPRLFDITELQREANRRFGYTAAQTLAVAQSLYESHKVLSYPRTDSRYITEDLVPYVSSFVSYLGRFERFAGAVDALLSAGLTFDGNVVDDGKVTDHHALLPTEHIKTLDSLALSPKGDDRKEGVTADMLNNIFGLVLCRMLVALSRPHLFERTEVKVGFHNGFVFSAAGSVTVSAGYKGIQDALLGQGADGSDTVGDDVDSPAEQAIPSGLSVGQEVGVVSCAVVERRTKPPKLHTEATLLSAMENAGARENRIMRGKGIGTQATRAEIIKKLFDTSVIETVRQGKTNYLKPTDKGLTIIRILPEEIRSPQMTADWETMMADIANGNATEKDFMDKFVPFIHRMVKSVLESQPDVSFRREREVHGVCPWCGGGIHAFENRNGKGKVDSVRFYCSANCGFQVRTNAPEFVHMLGKSMSVADVKRLIAKGSLTADFKSSKGTGTYKGEFSFSKRVVGERVYCNIKTNAVYGT